LGRSYEYNKIILYDPHNDEVSCDLMKKDVGKKRTTKLGSR